MKKVMFIAVAFAIMFASCKKEELNTNSLKPKYVEAVNGSFIPKEGDISLKKSADLTKVTRTWSMYAKNSTFYGSAPFALVKGLEFITGSAAYNFWSVPANNPVSFNVSQDGQVYSNLTPDEDLRCVLETKNSDNAVVYLGIVDFNPTTASFPLTVNGFRLGDKLTINADQLFNLPGGDRIAITATFNLSPIDLPATKLGAITGVSSQPTGTQFEWANVVYGTPVPTTISVGNGIVELYDGLDKKVTGTITITVTDNGSSLTPPTGGYHVTVNLNNEAGKGHALTLTTTKIGWYDSNFATYHDTDITVTSVDVPVN